MTTAPSRISSMIDDNGAACPPGATPRGYKAVDPTSAAFPEQIETLGLEPWAHAADLYARWEDRTGSHLSDQANAAYRCRLRKQPGAR